MKNGEIIERKDIRKSVYIRWTIIRGVEEGRYCVCRSIDITGYDLGKWRNRGVPPLANGKRIPRTILVHHVSDTSPFDCIVALPSFWRRKEERLGNGNTTSNSRSCHTKTPVNSRESLSLSLCFEEFALNPPQKLYQFLRNFPPLTSREKYCFRKGDSDSNEVLLFLLTSQDSKLGD